VSELAAAIGLERSTLTRNLKVLFAAGYLEDTAKSGSRKRSIQVSPAGEQVLRGSFPLWEKAQEEAAAVIGADQYRFFMERLSALEEL
jgi:DNA-binding MarR family transcriptional regulator